MKTSLKRLTLLSILKRQAEKAADRLDDDLPARVQPAIDLISWIAIFAALVVILIPAVLKIMGY